MTIFSIRIDVYHHGAEEDFLRTLSEKILTSLIRIERKGEKIMASAEEVRTRLAEVMAEMTAQTTRIDGIAVMIDGLQQQILDALAGTNVPESVLGDIDTIFATAKANTAKLDAAITDGTGGGENPPPPSP